MAAGSYTVTVKDDNSCQAIAGPVTITEPLNVSISSMGVPSMITCNGDANGSVTVTGSGGTGSRNYKHME